MHKPKSTATPPPAFVAILGELAEMRATMSRLEHQAIQLLRETGLTWEAIGDELGISRQAARSRFEVPRQRRAR
jgi:hypothetical protein